MLGLLCRLWVLIAIVGTASTACAQGSASLDTRTLPRLEGGTEAFTPSPRLTAYDLPAPAVQARAADAIDLLVKDGWQRHGHPNFPTTTSDSVVIATLKRGPDGLRVVVAHATKDATATRITYEARPLAHDLPFPTDGRDFAYNPDKPQLYAYMSTTPEAAREVMIRDMKASGWELATLRTRSGNPIFSKPNSPAVSLSVVRQNDGRTRILVMPLEGRDATTFAGAPTEPDDDDATDLKGLLATAKKMMSDAQEQTQRSRTQNKPAPTAAEPPLQALSSSFGAPVGLPETAEGMTYDNGTGRLEFTSPSSVRGLAAFYRTDMKARGWSEERSVINTPTMVSLNFKKARDTISFTIMAMGDKTRVSATGRGLVTAPPPPAQTDRPKRAAPPAPSGPPPEQVAGDKLEVSDQRGLIVPAPHASAGSERTRYRHDATATVAASIADILAFYERELSTRGWTELPGKKPPTLENAEVRYTAPEGPATLSLKRSTEAGATDIRLTVRKDAEARRDGMIPPAGQAKLVFGNIEDAAAVVKIQGKTIRVGGGVGAQAPDGPKLDLPPGTYTMTVQLGKQPAKPETVTLEAGRTWGVMIGPRGALSLPLY